MGAAGTFNRIGAIMDEDSAFEPLKEILSSTRTISVKNAARRAGIDLSMVGTIIKEMETGGLLRIVKSKGCGVSCSSCDTCSTGSMATLTGDEIVISLLYDRTKEYADESSTTALGGSLI